MISIAITGTHGTGETTLVRNLHGICRRQHRKTILITKIADGCPFKINEDATPRSQDWIFHEQMRRELVAHNADPDIIISDRSIMDNIVYFTPERQQKDISICPDSFLAEFNDGTVVFIKTHQPRE